MGKLNWDGGQLERKMGRVGLSRRGMVHGCFILERMWENQAGWRKKLVGLVKKETDGGGNLFGGGGVAAAAPSERGALAACTSNRGERGEMLFSSCYKIIGYVYSYSTSSKLLHLYMLDF